MNDSSRDDRRDRPEPAGRTGRGHCLDRRRFLLVGGAGAMAVLLGDLFPGRVHAADDRRAARLARYPRRKVGTVSGLNPQQPVEFLYPDDGPHSMGFLVKLGRPAGGGVGPGHDIVAFNALCPHQGGLLQEAYRSGHAVAGPCPLHLTTFDLTRHGMVVAGHATENLPQVVLEVEGDDLLAVGILGLIYGYPGNLAFTGKR